MELEPRDEESFEFFIDNLSYRVRNPSYGWKNCMGKSGKSTHTEKANYVSLSIEKLGDQWFKTTMVCL